jgi:mannose-1-phosphate guanylyltransferase
MKIVPVILSGSSGARFWSLSRKQHLKNYSTQYNLGRYLMHKYNKENLLNQWLLVRGEP